MVDLARLLYVAVTLLRFSEREAWKKTPYQVMRLFRIHKEFNPDKFKPEPPDEAAALDDMLDSL